MANTLAVFAQNIGERKLDRLTARDHVSPILTGKSSKQSIHRRNRLRG